MNKKNIRKDFKREVIDMVKKLASTDKPTLLYSSKEIDIMELDINSEKIVVGKFGMISFIEREDDIFFEMEDTGVNFILLKQTLINVHNVDFNKLEKIARNIGIFYWLEENEIIDEIKNSLKDEEMNVNNYHFLKKINKNRNENKDIHYEDNNVCVFNFKSDDSKTILGNYSFINYGFEDGDLFFASEVSDKQCALIKERLKEHVISDFKILKEVAKYIGLYYWFKDNYILEEVGEKLRVTK